MRSLTMGIVCWALASGLVPPAHGRSAPEAQYLATTWTSEDGLPQNSVTSILQTRDGYLWLATFGGLARFDGVSFTAFTPTLNPGLRQLRPGALTPGLDRHLQRVEL